MILARRLDVRVCRAIVHGEAVTTKLDPADVCKIGLDTVQSLWEAFKNGSELTCALTGKTYPGAAAPSVAVIDVSHHAMLLAIWFTEIFLGLLATLVLDRTGSPSGYTNLDVGKWHRCRDCPRCPPSSSWR